MDSERVGRVLRQYLVDVSRICAHRWKRSGVHTGGNGLQGKAQNKGFAKRSNRAHWWKRYRAHRWKLPLIFKPQTQTPGQVPWRQQFPPGPLDRQSTGSSSKTLVIKGSLSTVKSDNSTLTPVYGT